MHLSDTYNQAVNGCVICNGSDTPAVETGRDVTGDPRDGKVWVCPNCVLEMGHLHGMLTPDESDVLRAERVTAAAEADAYRDALATLRTRIETIVNETLESV